MKVLKKIKFAYAADQKNWVGNGFHVHGLLRPTEELNKFISPFVMLDYASPKEFSNTSERRGVGEHPHRGIETVTFAYQGEVEHRDSSGGGGKSLNSFQTKPELKPNTTHIVRPIRLK